MISWIFEYPESAVLFLLALVYLIIVLCRRDDLMKPMNVYCLSQMSLLGIAYLKLNRAMTDFRLTTWLFWGGALVSFFAGCLLLDWAWRACGGPVLHSPLNPSKSYDWGKHVALCFVAFGFFLIGVFGVISIAGNFILFTEHPGLWMGKNPKAGSLAIYFCSSPMVVGLFGVAAFKAWNPSRKLRIISRVMIPVTIALSFMTFPNRGTTFICVGILFVLYNYLHRKLSFLVVGIFSAVLLVAFVAIAMLRDQYSDNSVNGAVLGSALDLPYKYIANNYWNFDYALNPPSDRPRGNFTYGVDALFGIDDLVHIGSAIRTSNGWDSPYNESAEKVTGLNTVLYVWDAYKDFGVPGVILLPLFFGFLFTYIYRKMAVARTPGPLLFHSMFVFWILQWSFTTGYKQPMYWIWIMFFLLIPALCSKEATSGCDLCEKNSLRELQ